jgi:hypothetical protein
VPEHHSSNYVVGMDFIASILGSEHLNVDPLAVRDRDLYRASLIPVLKGSKVELGMSGLGLVQHEDVVQVKNIAAVSGVVGVSSIALAIEIRLEPD